jgi:predicted RNase H-like HicB family nuclease
MTDHADPFAPLHADGQQNADDPKQAHWQPILPAPMEPPEPTKTTHYRHGRAVARWVYRTARGEPQFAVYRFDIKSGDGTAVLGRDGKPKKEFLPYVYGNRNGKLGWHSKAPPTPRPLYGLDRLAASPGADVLLVEGERTADAAALLFSDYVVMSWPGGSGAVEKADWSVLNGRRVAVWPDADQPGRKAASAVLKHLNGKVGAQAAVVSVPDNWPEGWDLADLNDAARPQPDGITPEVARRMIEEALAGPSGADDPYDPYGSGDTSRARTSVDDLNADVALAAKMTRAEYSKARLQMAKRHGIRVGDLDGLRAEAQRTGRESPRQDDTPSCDGTRPDLYVNMADQPHTAADVASMLSQQLHIFDRGGPVLIAHDRARGSMVVQQMTANTVVNQVHSICRPWTWDGKGDALDKIYMTLPERVAKLALDGRAWWLLRPLDGITSAPLLHADGTVRAHDGYDAQTRLWCENVPEIDLPTTITRDAAEDAFRALRHHFRTFPFADASRHFDPELGVEVVDLAQPPGMDESAYLCGLLTAVCRPCLALAPGLMLHAPAFSGAGTGKGLLARAACAIAFGTLPAAMTIGSSPEEMDKRISAALMQAHPAMLLDNVNGVALKSDVLASAITERPASVRKLGYSEIVHLNPTTFVVVTGNGLSPSEDMARRLLTVGLDARVEDPEARSFREDFVGETFARRPTLLRHLLMIWRWGRQQGDALPMGRPMGSFIEWGRWCRDPLLALGCADPAQRILEAKAHDPRRDQVVTFLDAWWHAHGSEPTAVAELAPEVITAAGIASQNRQSLAHFVKQLVGIRIAGFTLQCLLRQGRWSAHHYKLQREG